VYRGGPSTTLGSRTLVFHKGKDLFAPFLKKRGKFPREIEGDRMDPENPRAFLDSLQKPGRNHPILQERERSLGRLRIWAAVSFSGDSEISPRTRERKTSGGGGRVCT